MITIIFNSITLTFNHYTGDFSDTEIDVAQVMNLNGDVYTNIISEDIDTRKLKILLIRASELTNVKAFVLWAMKGNEFTLDGTTYKFKPDGNKRKISDYLKIKNQDWYDLDLNLIEA